MRIHCTVNVPLIWGNSVKINRSHAAINAEFLAVHLAEEHLWAIAKIHIKHSDRLQDEFLSFYVEFDFLLLFRPLSENLCKTAKSPNIAFIILKLFNA